MSAVRGSVMWRPLLPLKRRSRVAAPNLGSQTWSLGQERATNVHTDPNFTKTPSTQMTKSKTQSDPKPTPKWQSVAWQKKDQQFARIPSQWRLSQLPPSDVTNYLSVPRECGLLTEKELDITENYDATGLARAIREKKVTCVDVATAFCKVHIPSTNTRETPAYAHTSSFNVTTDTCDAHRPVILTWAQLTKTEGCNCPPTDQLPDRDLL